MVIGIIGENCSGKSTLAGAIKNALGGEIVTGKDYLRLAKSEGEARSLFCEKLKNAVSGSNIIYVISEPEHAALLPDGAVRVLVSADLETIKERFRARMRGNLPAPVAGMLEKKHGMFDGGNYDYRYDGVGGDPASLCESLRKAIAERTPRYLTLRDCPERMKTAAQWFHGKWGVPEQAYLDCMTAYLNCETEYGWYLCLYGEQIIGGLGVIENDFHDRKDLSPNVCAVYTEEAWRRRGVAGRLLNMAVEDMRAKGVSPLYLVTDHTGFYERYGWEFLCMVQGDGEPELTRMYIHR